MSAGDGSGRPSFPSLGGVARGALARPSWWGVDHVLLERKELDGTPQFLVSGEGGDILLFCQQKLLALKDDLRVYSDATMKVELLTLVARQIVDFSAAYDVIDSRGDRDKVGLLRRRGTVAATSKRDEWELCNAEDQQIGLLRETSSPLLRRVIRLPERLQFSLGEEVVGVIKRSWNPFVFKAEMDLSADSMRRLDRRLALACGLLLMAIEPHQAENRPPPQPADIA